MRVSRQKRKVNKFPAIARFFPCTTGLFSSFSRFYLVLDLASIATGNRQLQLLEETEVEEGNGISKCLFFYYILFYVCVNFS